MRAIDQAEGVKATPPLRAAASLHRDVVGAFHHILKLFTVDDAIAVGIVLSALHSAYDRVEVGFVEGTDTVRRFG